MQSPVATFRRRQQSIGGLSYVVRPVIAASLALVAAALVTPSSAHAVAIALPVAAATTSGSLGWGFGWEGQQQVVQNLFPSSELAGLNPGDTILGLTIRADGFPFPGSLDSPYTFPRFDIAIGPGTSSLTTALTTNFTSQSTMVRTGSLTVGQGFFQAPLAFGSMIPFDSPYTYGGGNLLIELRTISAQVGFSADLMAATQTSGQLAYAFGDANATTATAISQYNFAMQLNVVPEPSTWVMAAVGIFWAGRGAWRRRKRPPALYADGYRPAAHWRRAPI